MKTRIRQILRPITTAAVLLSMTVGAAAQTASTATATEAADSSGSAAPPLAPGVADIVKMTHAHVGDQVILSYVGSSGTVYSLDASQVVYLRSAGVSEPVVSAMLNKWKRYSDQAAANTAAQSSAAPATQPQTVYATTAYAEPAPVVVQPVVVEPAAPSVSVYVIPYSPTSSGYSYYPNNWCYSGTVFYSYYRPYYGYGCRSFSVPYRSGYSGYGRGFSYGSGFRGRR
jgi:hypothetical protein